MVQVQRWYGMWYTFVANKAYDSTSFGHSIKRLVVSLTVTMQKNLSTHWRSLCANSRGECTCFVIRDLYSNSHGSLVCSSLSTLSWQVPFLWRLSQKVVPYNRPEMHRLGHWVIGARVSRELRRQLCDSLKGSFEMLPKSTAYCRTLKVSSQKCETMWRSTNFTIGKA